MLPANEWRTTGLLRRSSVLLGKMWFIRVRVVLPIVQHSSMEQSGWVFVCVCVRWACVERASERACVRVCSLLELMRCRRTAREPILFLSLFSSFCRTESTSLSGKALATRDKGGDKRKRRTTTMRRQIEVKSEDVWGWQHHSPKNNDCVF
jgi:hypothetical protein